MSATTPTGIPVERCDRCGRVHPVTRAHCSGCGRASAFLDDQLVCVYCRSADGGAAMDELPILYPTLPGKAPGIIAWDPLKMQCGDCGAIHEQCHRSIGACILTAGYEFHTCETGAPRRCPACLARALTECGSTRCADQLREARSALERGAA